MSAYNYVNKCIFKSGTHKQAKMLNIWLVVQVETMEAPVMSLVCHEHLLVIHSWPTEYFWSVGSHTVDDKCVCLNSHMYFKHHQNDKSSCNRELTNYCRVVVEGRLFSNVARRTALSLLIKCGISSRATICMVWNMNMWCTGK
jgi:hypothetical protein